MFKNVVKRETNENPPNKNPKYTPPQKRLRLRGTLAALAPLGLALARKE